MKIKDKIICIEIYTHLDLVENRIGFEESDLRVVSIGNNEKLFKEDFDKLWKAINEIDTKDLKAEEWYRFDFMRACADDGNGYYQCWFDLIDKTLIKID